MITLRGGKRLKSRERHTGKWKKEREFCKVAKFCSCCLKQHQCITIIRNGIDVPLPERQLLQRERTSRVGKDSLGRQCLRVAKPKTRSESHEQMQQNGGLQVIQFNGL